MDVWNLEAIKAELEKREIAFDREAASLARWVMEDILVVKRDSKVQPEFLEKYEQALFRLSNGVPVQYIAGHAWFFGEKFKVNTDVLIPRPETEELVDWIISDCNLVENHIRILDVGTGSGCIAITLKLKLGSKCTVTAIDISNSALDVAKENSRILGAEVDFRELDFLKSSNALAESFDIIVSNPPYIEKSNISEEIFSGLQHEPSVALYPVGQDVDVFYRRLGESGGKLLNTSGVCYVELNEFRINQIESLFTNNQWINVEIRKDMQGATRMLKASKG